MMRSRQRILAAILSGLMVAFPVVAQESTETDDGAPVTGNEETDEEKDEPREELVIEDEGLDRQGFEKEDDDDFIPTEEIGADQSIPFPTDI